MPNPFEIGEVFTVDNIFNAGYSINNMDRLVRIKSDGFKRDFLKRAHARRRNGHKNISIEQEVLKLIKSNSYSAKYLQSFFEGFGKKELSMKIQTYDDKLFVCTIADLNTGQILQASGKRNIGNANIQPLHLQRRLMDSSSDKMVIKNIDTGRK